MAEGIDDKNTFGWHNFLRYSIPGYICLLFFLIGAFLLIGNFNILFVSFPNLIGILIPALFLMAGYPLGTVIYLLYDALYTSEGKHKRVHVKYISSRTNSTLEHFEARAIWDSVLLSEKGSPLKNRIFFISNMAQTHGAILAAIMVSIALSFIFSVLYLNTLPAPWVMFRFLVFLFVLVLVSVSSGYLYNYYLHYLDAVETCFIGQSRPVQNIDKAIKDFLKAREQIPSNGVK